ncbi:protein TolQ [Ectothiorhodospiraceae bacterium 2226]|nr:protein TolQ [Ectothiorhodospiraceae bacterium 2226]
MTADLSLLHLILGASPLVQLVMLILVVASVLSWTLIFKKGKRMKDARVSAEHFEQRFWSGGELGELYKKVAARREGSQGLEAIFEAGFREYVKLRSQGGVPPMAMVEGAQRAMRIALSREADRLETNLSFLATVGSTSPYIGLFGTVWGIMNSFRALGGMQQVTVATVAPGIAEALIATAMGLFAAIPAVIAYNRYTNDMDRLLNRYDTFVEELSSLLQRQAHA